MILNAGVIGPNGTLSGQQKDRTVGTSTNGQLCYGTAFVEDFEFPWGDGEIEYWWTYTVHGFKHSFELKDQR